MAQIALLYHDSELTDLDYSDTPADGEQELFTTIKNRRSLPSTTVVDGITNAGRQYSHVKYSHRSYDVVISSNEIVDSVLALKARATVPSDTILDFLEDFWNATYKYVCNPANAGSHYERVITEGGDFPIEYVDDLIYFPEVTFKLKKASKE